MDGKELKTCLKSARDAIRSKDYKDALKHCKTILKVEKDNYNALVFVGVAAEGLDQPEQALAAYRKAVEADDSQLLAWQGMCSFFEKCGKEEHNVELTSVYERLLKFFENDETKKHETERKLIDLYEKLKIFKKAFDHVKKMISSLKEDVPLDLWKKLINLAEHSSNDDVPLVQRGYKILLKAVNEDDKQKLHEEYLNLLLKVSTDREELIQECNILKTDFPASIKAYEIMGRICLMMNLDKSCKGTLDTEELIVKLQSLDSKNVVLMFLEAHRYFRKQQFMDAKPILVKALQQENNFLPACLLLAKVQLGVHEIQAAEKCLQKAARLLEEDICTYGTAKEKLSQNFLIVEANILLQMKRPECYEEALVKAEKILGFHDYQKDGLLVKADVLIDMKEYSKAKEVLNELTEIDKSAAACLLGKLHILNNDIQEAENSFLKALEGEESNPMALYHLAKIYWDKCGTEKSLEGTCQTYLLKAAKADPYFSPCFLYLGHYYAKIQKDLVKAKKCYQKSYNLDSSNEEAGVALVDIFNSLDQESQSLGILQNVTTRASAGTCKWAWLRLGLYHLKHEDPTKAIMSLQSALRADPSDYHCWECLGEAYLSRGSYTAACKAFTKATDLQPQNIYSFYQIATIKLTLGVYPEAIVDYKKILDTSPDYVPALKGLGETHLLQAKAAIREFFHGRAVDYCTDAIRNLTRAAHQKPEFSCLWKLLGDSCTILHVIPADMCAIEVPAILLGSGKTLEEFVTLQKMDMLALGSRCYGMALKSQPDCATLFNDLGLSYYHQTRLADKIGSKALMAKAFQAFEKALQLDSSNYKYWNAMGLVALTKEIDNKALAQHSFIKSIQAEHNNVVAWTNLGILYMECDDLKLAHEALKGAQNLEPSYVASWIGQALIAETVGQEEEAMDLFRHTTDLAHHTEGALGYAHYVCGVLRDKNKAQTDWNRYIIEHMYAVTAASDVLAKYTDRIKTNSTAFNLYGLLLERQKLYKDSAKAFDTAVNLLQSCKDKELLRKAKLNLARVLVHNGDFERAIKLYKDVGTATFEEQCSYALALYKMENYTESYEQYEAALNSAERDEDKSHVCAAMGMVKYKMGEKESGRGDVEGAKTEMFKCIQFSPPSVHGLNGLLSLGLIQYDLTLATAAIHELSQFVSHNTSEDFTYMKASLHALKGETIEGKRSLAKFIHSQPDKAQGWSYMVQYLLTHESDLTDTVSRCCHIGLAMDVKKKHKNLCTWLALALLGTGQHSRTEYKYNSYSAAQKAVFLYPDNLESWVALISTMYAEMVTMRCLKQKEKLTNSLLPLVTHFMGKVESFLSQKEGNTPRLQALHLWCVKQYIVALLAAGRKDQAQQFLQQAMWLYDEDQSLQNLLAFLNQNFSVLKLNAVNDSHGFIRQMLVKLYLIHGLVDDAENILKMWLPQARTQPRKILALVRLAFFAFKQIMDGGDKEKLRSIFTEACDECMKIDSHVSVIHFMISALSLVDSNKKQTKKSLQTTLKYYNENHGLMYGKTTARKQLLEILLEKDDNEAAQELLVQALSDGDTEFVDYASKFVKIAEQKSEEN